ncbi:hypothetical protein OB236_11735 [Paenibacillus sp. WQ 127069]|uniref:Uncharacterized protein n=1 Tax=Paenibacillus baimaensis TaxID=2982185 RepID=A0ABT2UFV9_9BACL|nr:hypothetical protein [Paenibacillus sp. WQ 127069]MCU6792792.1 hypothetical protein [Paenibacillus sp. WQ 127069]
MKKISALFIFLFLLTSIFSSVHAAEKALFMWLNIISLEGAYMQMKKISALFLSLFLLTSVFSSVHAAEETLSIWLNGEQIQFSKFEPIIDNEHRRLLKTAIR